MFYGFDDNDENPRKCGLFVVQRDLFRLSSIAGEQREKDILLEICSNDADVAVKVRIEKKLFFFKD